MSEKATETDITRVCPSCGRVLKEEYVACPYCGKDLTGKEEADKHIPKSIKRYLLRGERVIDWTGSYSSPGATFYITNKRLIKHKESLIGELLGSFDLGADYFNVELQRITSITLHKYRPRISFILGIFLGLFFLFVSIFFFLLPPPHPAYTGPDPRVPMGVVFLLLGLFFAGLLCRIKQSYHQVNVRNSSRKDLKEWRIFHPRKGKEAKEKTERFITSVQDEIDRGVGAGTSNKNTDLK